jgi:hypothetical protein
MERETMQVRADEGAVSKPNRVRIETTHGTNDLSGDKTSYWGILCRSCAELVAFDLSLPLIRAWSSKYESRRNSVRPRPHPHLFSTRLPIICLRRSADRCGNARKPGGLYGYQSFTRKRHLTCRTVGRNSTNPKRPRTPNAQSKCVSRVLFTTCRDRLTGIAQTPRESASGPIPRPRSGGVPYPGSAA